MDTFTAALEDAVFDMPTVIDGHPIVVSSSPAAAPEHGDLSFLCGRTDTGMPWLACTVRMPSGGGRCIRAEARPHPDAKGALSPPGVALPLRAFLPVLRVVNDIAALHFQAGRGKLVAVIKDTEHTLAEGKGLFPRPHFLKRLADSALA